MGKMEDTKAKLVTVCNMFDRMTDCVNAQISQGLEHVDAKELGEAVDVVKDLAEAKKLMLEACYYETVIEAMDEKEKEPVYVVDGADRYGYNHRHMASGRFAPVGRGHVVGYPIPSMKPMMDQMPYVEEYLNDPDFEERMRHERTGHEEWDKYGPMGYTPNSSMNRMTHETNQMGQEMRNGMNRHGRSFENWRTARRHYTETKNDADRKEMDAYAAEHLSDTVTTMKEMYKEADPEMKKRIKGDLQKLLNDITASA